MAVRKLHLICPVCGKNRRIPLPNDIFKHDEGYLLKVPIHRGVVCDHAFVAVLDYRFSVRDYEVPESGEFAKIFATSSSEPQFGEVFDYY